MKQPIIKKLIKISNYENESESRLAQNYFFIGTLFIIGFTCLCHFVFHDVFLGIVTNIPFLNIVLKSFRHLNDLHLFGNMISIVWIGLFFESKIGSLKYVALFFAAVILGNLASSWYMGSFNGAGGSSANYCLFGFLCLFLIYNFRRYMFEGKKSIFNWVLLVLIIFFFLIIAGDTSGAFSMNFGRNLISNSAHLYPFIAGLIIGLIYCVLKYVWKKFRV